MLNVRAELCAGCGICARVCPTGAISLDTGTAHIDRSKCINCYRCIQECPRGAIATVGPGLKPTPITIWELRNDLLRMQVELRMAAQRLKSLEQREKVSSFEKA